MYLREGNQQLGQLVNRWLKTTAWLQNSTKELTSLSTPSCPSIKKEDNQSFRNSSDTQPRHLTASLPFNQERRDTFHKRQFHFGDRAMHDSNGAYQYASLCFHILHLCTMCLKRMSIFPFNFSHLHPRLLLLVNQYVIITHLIKKMFDMFLSLLYKLFTMFHYK